MQSRTRGLTTFAAATATVSLSLFAAEPNVDLNRFTPSTLQVEPEVATSAIGAQGAAAQTVAPEPPSSGSFREAPTGFDNRTNGFDPQGPDFDGLTEDTSVALRSFNDNRFVFEEVEKVADGLGPTYNAQSCRECHQNIVTGGAARSPNIAPGAWTCCNSSSRRAVH